MLKKLNYLVYKKLNLQIFSPLLKFFKNIHIIITGFDVKLKIKKKNIINYLFILKKNSSFLFTMLIDLVVEDFPKKKNRYIVKYFIRSLVYCKTIQVMLKVKEYKPIFSLINLYKSSF
jgi:NADH:ubiquinone oxidoreductase subunit C